MLEINLRVPTEPVRILINCVNASIIKKKNGIVGYSLPHSLYLPTVLSNVMISHSKDFI